jgi:peptidoglycan hydrolase-like protein with peptidoglycan-binding domain
MARDFFRRTTSGIPVSGTTITDVQASLNAASAFNIDVDGKFGPQTQDALTGFQHARGLEATGTVSDQTWSTLMRTPEPPIFERCLQVTASFEGTGFDLIEGNFDGAGLTWGIIGFTLVNGELGEVLAEINSLHPDLFGQAFGSAADHILAVTGKSTPAADKLAFANSVSGPAPQFRVAEPWRSCFAKLGQMREVQKIEVTRARTKYWTAIAVRDAAELGLKEELDLLLLFDIAVQDGGMGSDNRLQAARDRLTPQMSGTERRVTIAQVVADTVSPRFKDDVLARKTCIATGRGKVHQGDYVLDAWGFLDGAVPVSTGVPTGQP